jgi:hypothetical protein
MFQAIERMVETRHRNSRVGSVCPVAASLKCVAACDRRFKREVIRLPTAQPDDPLLPVEDDLPFGPIEKAEGC